MFDSLDILLFKIFILNWISIAILSWQSLQLILMKFLNYLLVILIYIFVFNFFRLDGILK